VSALAIITARGGSKRIPRKNLRPFLGEPIIGYSIAAALESGLFDEVMVSTDDDEIAALARERGALVPFMRSAATSDDYATTADVLKEVVAEYRNRGIGFDRACCLYPTAPFVTAAKLRDAFARLEESGADAVLPVTRFSFPIWRSFRMEGDRVFYNWPEHAPRRSQDLPPAYQDAGQFYVFRPAVLEATGLLVTTNTMGLEVPEVEVQDIDSEEDWTLAELKYRHIHAVGAPLRG
jgi:pseudaminic acid cytidylyltransferase